MSLEFYDIPLTVNQCLLFKYFVLELLYVPFTNMYV